MSDNVNLNSNNVRIGGGDFDAVWVGALGAVMPTGIDAPTNHKHTGSLSDDGMELSFDDNTETFNGHQGGRVIRKKVTSSEATFTFTAAETTLLTLGLAHNITEITKTDGVARAKASVSKKSNDRRSWVVDVWDGNPGQEGSIWYRYLFPSGETGERPTLAFKNNEITLYETQVTVYDDYEFLTNDPAVLNDEDVEAGA
ncbi:hypothetical protein [Brachybacterium sp. GPGPB12]|uniref:hypothetical protein n=1 Tax=Brachybacterium sp. GPGPB12 TaxID=3023517 RepID=UPI0031342FB4